MATDRLPVLDASFLALESPAAPLQTGGLGIFGPGLDFSDVSHTLDARLHRLRKARQRVQPAPLGLRPTWVDDPEFDLSFHLRHAALPAPGGPDELGELLARILSRPLDRRRPLWELYVIEGLEGGRTGVLRKVHLAAAGQDVDIFSLLLDSEPDPGGEPVPVRAWRPAEPAGQGELAVDAVREGLDRLLEAGRGIGEVLATPGRAVRAAGDVAGSAARLALRAVRRTPISPLNVRLSPHRRFAMARVDLDDLRRVRRAYGGTINDAVVAVVGDAVGRLLRWRGHDTKDLDLRVMVPVRVNRSPERDPEVTEARSIGHGVVGVLAPLPVMQMDPVARLYRVMGELAGLRESRQAVAADDLVRLAGYAPPNLHALAARLASAEQRYNLALSNAPGPQQPRYLKGVPMEASYPFIPLAGDSALSIAVTSYVGGMYFGILGDRRGMPDLDLLGGFLDQAVADLVASIDSAAG